MNKCQPKEFSNRKQKITLGDVPRDFFSVEVIRLKLKLFVFVMILSVFVTGFGLQDSPEAALNEIKIALNERDETKLSRRVNIDEFFSQIYDATTIELAKNYDDYHEKYPDDPYFNHSAEFLTEYNAVHKERHLKFADEVKESFFAKVPAPSKPEKNPTAYVADEFDKICAVTSATVKDTIVDGDDATLVLDVRGDNSLRGHFVGRLTFKLAFHRDGELWRLKSLENLDELTPVLVDKAELVWITFF